MNVKLYDDYTDNELLWLIKNFNLPEKKTIYLTVTEFLSEPFILKNIPDLFSNWKEEKCIWGDKETTDYICNNTFGGYFCYTYSDGIVKMGDFFGKNYQESIKNFDIHYFEFKLPINLSYFIKLCLNNNIFLKWKNNGD